MPESRRHKELVDLIIAYLGDEKEGREIRHLRVANRDDYDAPEPVGSYQPDVYAEVDDGGVTWAFLGEAELDINDHATEQLTQFTKHVHNVLVSGLVVAVPAKCRAGATQVLEEVTGGSADILYEEPEANGDAVLVVVLGPGIENPPEPKPTWS